ncbi:hypothetical protein FACUT_14106 [Fusarium acutatum]|uniref:HTH CENPB-type domain-containing protein n=1 Tax=Fusarium acutatum TaxID=78861 RepID=A0A8H4J900_9HYPO|nr:hypothetical protein FACUT_14106 [Fusarium acutatum]
MPSFTEKDMSAALQMVADGQIKGSTTPREAQKPRQKLSDTQEKHLRDWIVIQADLGCPVSHQQVREFASKIAVRNGFPEGVGKNWLQGFLGRNPDIRTLKGKKIDSDRYHRTSSELIKAFFMLLMMPAIRLVKQGNRYNVDEVGMMEGIGMNVFGPLKRAYCQLLLDLTSISNDSHIGKITFLYTYDKAQREAIMKSNAIAGFKATGLWPVNLAKVLMNPMVTETPSPAITANSPAKEQDLSLLKTPRSSVQLRQALGQVPASAT